MGEGQHTLECILSPMSSSPVTALGVLPSSCPILRAGVGDVINVTKNNKEKSENKYKISEL